jgi:hypothetical protein
VRFGPKGSPDIHGYLKGGRALFVEVKRPSGRVSPEQREFIERAAKHGCVAILARSVDELWKAMDAERSPRNSA